MPSSERASRSTASSGRARWVVGEGLGMQCAECGAESAEATQVCARCGAPITQQWPVAADPSTGEPNDPIAPFPHQLVRQQTGSRFRRGALVLAGTGLVVLTAVIAVIATSSSSTSSAPSTPPAPSATSGFQLTEDQLQPGDCLQGSDLGLGIGSPWPVYFTVVPCTQPHLGEVFFARNVWPQSLPYPGDDTISNQAEERCADAFFVYVAGSVHHTANFAYEPIAPDSNSWPDGDRLVVCVAYQVTEDSYPDAAPVDFSIKGSHQ